MADEAVAETFLIAWRKIEDVPDGDEALPWLFAVAYRTLGHQRRSATRRTKLAVKLASVGATQMQAPEDYIVIRQEAQRIIEALSRLKAKDQEILRLSVWEELTHDQIAQMFDLSATAVRKRLSRARQRLAREFGRIEKRVTPPLLRKEVHGDQ